MISTQNIYTNTFNQKTKHLKIYIIIQLSIKEPDLKQHKHKRKKRK